MIKTSPSTEFPLEERNGGGSFLYGCRTWLCRTHGTCIGSIDSQQMNSTISCPFDEKLSIPTSCNIEIKNKREWCLVEDFCLQSVKYQLMSVMTGIITGPVVFKEIDVMQYVGKAPSKVVLNVMWAFTTTALGNGMDWTNKSIG